MNSIDCIQDIKQSERWVGAYVLHIRYSANVRVRIGRVNNGNPVVIEPGHYVYIGSAMGNGAGLYLPKRLLRHTIRTAQHPPHSCHGPLLSHLNDAGIPNARLMQQSPKRLFWNIDYLLNQSEADLQDILYIRSDSRQEFTIVKRLESYTGTSAPFPGLGANDHRGHSHFLAIQDTMDAWQDCVKAVVGCVNGEKS